MSIEWGDEVRVAPSQLQAPVGVPNEQVIQTLDDDEVQGFARVPTVDAINIRPGKFALTKDGFIDSLIFQAVDTPAVTGLMLGRRMNENGKHDGDLLIREAEKLRDFGFAMRRKFLTAESLAPETTGEKFASGLGSGGGSILGMILASAGGAAAGATIFSAGTGPEAAPIGAVVGAGVATVQTSYMMEKAMMAQELMDAGYSAKWADRISSMYAIPVAALDAASFKILGNLIRKPAAEAISNRISKYWFNALFHAGEGMLSEGGTEAVQQRIQTEFEIATKLKDRNWQRDLVDDALAGTIGALYGGSAGVAGQLRIRREMVERIKKDIGLPHKAIANLVDDILFQANQSTVDTLSQHFDVTDEMAAINARFAKIQGRNQTLDESPTVQFAEMPDEYQQYQDLYEGMKLDSKVRSLSTQIEKSYAERFEAGRDASPEAEARVTAAAKNLADLKTQNREAIESSPALKAMSEELDTLLTEVEIGTKELTPETLNRINALRFRLKNPGEIESVAKAAEQMVSDLEAVEKRLSGEITAAEVGLINRPDLPQLYKVYDDVVQELLAAGTQAEAYRQLTNRVQFGVALKASEVRKLARQQLRDVLDAFKAGKKLAETDLKTIQMAFKTLIAGHKLSGRAARNLLRSVLSIRTAEQFDAKIQHIIENVNTVIKAERVREFQDLGLSVLQKMLPKKGNVEPKTQVFAEHLIRVFRGRVPPSLDVDTAQGAELSKAMVEQAAYDLGHAEADAGAAERAFLVLKDYYQDGLQRFGNFKAAQEAEIERLQGLVRSAFKGEFNERQAAFDSTRQEDKQKKHVINFTPFDKSTMSILDVLDNDSGAKSMEGPLVQAFDSNRPYLAYVVTMGRARERIDGELYRIYGKRAPRVWLEYRTKDFINIEFVEGQPVNISRGEAMSLYLMTKMPGVFNDLLRMGVKESWLLAFERGDNVQFTKQDYEFMRSMRETLDWFADQIGPVFERLTHRPFRRVDNYFMTDRFLVKGPEEGGYAEKSSIVSSLLGQGFQKLDPTSLDRLKERKWSDALYRVPDLFEAMSYYSRDMAHFINYAEYAVKMQKVFQDPGVQKLMKAKAPGAYPAVLKEYTDMLIQGSADRTADRRAMAYVMKTVGLYARNQISTLKNFFRQITGVAASMDLEGAGPKAFVEALLDLPRAVKTGELQRLTETTYMKERFSGFYDIANLYIQEMARPGKFKGEVSQAIHNFFTTFPRYGDRYASAIVGWMIYRDRVKKGVASELAVIDAIKAIDVTQQSMDPGKVPVAFNRAGFWNRLLTIFQRTPAIYFDRYVRSWDAMLKGRISKRQWIRTMVTYHFWVPLFESLVTAGDWEPDETLLAMAAGPLSFHLFMGAMIRSVLGGVMELFSDNEADLPQYVQELGTPNLLESILRDIKKATFSVLEILKEGPDYEMMWDATKSVADVSEAVVPVPSGWLARLPEAFFNLAQLDPDSMKKGMKQMIGYSDARTRGD